MTDSLIRQRPLPTSAGAWPAAMPAVLRRIYLARGIDNAGQLPTRMAQMADPFLLGGIELAAALLARAVMSGQRICLAGDFDADGATGCAVGVLGLSALGARDPCYVVPNRATDGYGLSPRLVTRIVALGAEVVVTVDNGIAAIAGVAAAKARGLVTIVTDHHLPGAQLPAADAIVNPNLLGDGFPSKSLAGVGVLFQVLIATRAALRDAGWFDARRAPPDLATLLDLVALGTVADMVALDFNNRLLVSAGLKRIRQGLAAPGIAALFAVAGRDPAQACAQDLGFAIAPRINAAGRLEDMSLGVACLIAADRAVAERHAAALDAINRERRVVQEGMQHEADAAIARALGRGGKLPPALVLFDPGWHAGVVGLIASRLKEQTHRPVVALAPGGDDPAELKGSLRSVPGVHIRDVLVDVDTRHPGLLDRYGGHAMAAGLSVQRARLDEFSRAFIAAVAERSGELPEVPVLWTDGELTPAQATADLASAIRHGGPWGQGFEEPCFEGEFEVEGTQVVGSAHLKLDLRFVGAATRIRAIHFGGASAPAQTRRVRLVYQLSVNEWRGERRVELLVRDRRPV